MNTSIRLENVDLKLAFGKNSIDIHTLAFNLLARLQELKTHTHISPVQVKQTKQW